MTAWSRSRSEYVQQLVSDIASYYGYNEFLAEKLFQLFPVSEVRQIQISSLRCLRTVLWRMRSHAEYRMLTSRA